MHLALVNPCENTICETLWKVYLFLAPLSPGSGQASRSTSPLSTVILNVFRLVVITIPKLIVSVIVLSFVCPKSFTIQATRYGTCQPTNLWWNTKPVTQFFRVHRNDRIVCNLPDLSCSHIFFSFKSLSRRSRNDRTSALLILFSLKVFSVSSTLAKGSWNKTA